MPWSFTSASHIRVYSVHQDQTDNMHSWLSRAYPICLFQTISIKPHCLKFESVKQLNFCFSLVINRTVTLFEPRCEKTSLRGFRPCPTQTGLYSHRRLKFRIWVVEGVYYPYSENKDADQLRSYCAADLRLCFRTCKNRFSHDTAHLQSQSQTH